MDQPTRLLKDYQPLLHAFFLSICQNASLTSDTPLEDILRNPKLIAIFNHATPISWAPAISFLTNEVLKAGGGDRLAIGVMDNFMYSNPLTKPLAEYITQSETPRGFQELFQYMQDREQVDLVIFPEGARTFFGSTDQIQEFRSNRFIELSIRLQAPLLLAIHRGSEDWNLNLSLPKEWGAFLLPFSKFFGEGLMQFGSLNLPVRLHKIRQFSMHLHLYSPALYESDLSMNPTERQHQLAQEGERIRELMQEIWNSLPH